MSEEKCDCINKINETLSKAEGFEGVYLCYTTNLTTRAKRAILKTERRGSGRGKLRPLMASFCPFCGVEY